MSSGYVYKVYMKHKWLYVGSIPELSHDTHTGILKFERKKLEFETYLVLRIFVNGCLAIVVVTESFRVLCDYPNILIQNIWKNFENYCGYHVFLLCRFCICLHYLLVCLSLCVSIIPSKFCDVLWRSLQRPAFFRPEKIHMHTRG